MNTNCGRVKRTEADSAGDKKITIIGAGLIGSSWVGLFLANGCKVTVFDAAADFEAKCLQYINEIKPTLTQLGYETLNLESGLEFAEDLIAAIDGANIIMESGPEDLGFKRKLWQEVELHCHSKALLLSSSSGMKASWQALGMKKMSSRLLIAHPFNPPHLMPLVEVVPGKHTAADAIAEAMELFKALGKHPVQIRKETPAFVANRLQAALMREAVALVNAGVVTPAELDEIVENSLGLRWAAQGPFKSSHLAGGEAGIQGYFSKFAKKLSLLWLQFQLKPVFLGNKLQNKIRQHLESTHKLSTLDTLVKQRDERQIEILKSISSDQ